MDLDSALQLKEAALAELGLAANGAGFQIHDAASRVLALAGTAMSALPSVVGAAGASGSGVGRVYRSARAIPGLQPIFGLGVALAGERRFKLAVRYPWNDRGWCPHLDRLTDMAGGREELDVEWTGPILAQSAVPKLWHQAPQRPVLIGSSVAHCTGTAGSVTGFVRRGGGPPVLLGCNHVLSDRGKTINDLVLQPGPGDEGKAADAIGHLATVVPLRRRRPNLVDCALAELKTGVEVDPARLEGYPTLSRVVDPSWFTPVPNDVVLAKLGRTTGATHGRVTAFGVTQRIAYAGDGSYQFAELLEIVGEDGSFSEAGDSGALVFDPVTGVAVGMVIAGSLTRSYATRLDTTLSMLGCELDSGGRP